MAAALYEYGSSEHTGYPIRICQIRQDCPVALAEVEAEQGATLSKRALPGMARLEHGVRKGVTSERCQESHIANQPPHHHNGLCLESPDWCAKFQQ